MPSNHPARVFSRRILIALAGACGWRPASASSDAAAPPPGETWELPLAAGSFLRLVWIPPGSFSLGSPDAEPGRKPDEGPQTRVTITRGFWLGETFVTIGDWTQVMGVGVREQLIGRIRDDTLCDFGGEKMVLRDLMRWSREADPAASLANEDDALPIYFVSWNEAMEFAGRLNVRERAAGRLPPGYAYTLPTEAQWEYACRAGTTTPTCGGGNAPATLERIAWYDRNSAEGYEDRRIGPTRSGPRIVKQKEPNGWGLCDMQGNIWQWCLDWYGPYAGGAVTDPIGPGAGTGRVKRGGSFGSGADSLRSAGRAGNPPAEASAYRGIRLALSPARSSTAPAPSRSP